MLGLLFSRSPDALERLLALGREYENLGYLRRAEWIFRRVINRGPPTAAAFFLLGRVQTRRGNLLEARRNYTKALELKPDFYLCRVNFFEICRQEYWTFHAQALAQVEQQLQTATEPTPELHMRRLHLLLSGGLFQQMRFEVARQDYDDLDVSVYQRLETTLSTMQASRRETRRFQQRLEETRSLFERMMPELARIREFEAFSGQRRARLHFRKKSPLEVSGLRDSDDLIGHHLEVISGGKLSFLGLDRLSRIDFGLHSEFIEAGLELRDGSHINVVVPGIYYGSSQSTLPELQHGEMTIFKEIYDGIQLGVGRRVFRAQHPYTGEAFAAGIHELKAIEFL